MSLTSLYDFQAYAQTLVEHARTKEGKQIIVKFVEADQASTIERSSRVEILLPKMNSKTSAEDLKLAKWYIVNQIVHLTEGKDFYNILNDHDLDPQKSPLASMAKGFEQARVEKADAKRYKGDAVVFSEGIELVAERTEQAFKKMDAMQFNDPDFQRVLAAKIMELKSQSDWNEGAGNVAERWKNLLNPEGNKALDILERNHVDDAIRELGDEHQSFELSKHIYDLLFDDSADEHMQEQKEAAEAERKEQGNKGKGKKEKAKGKGESGAGENDEGEGEEDGDGEEEGKGESSEKYKDTGKSVPYDMMNTSPGYGGSGIHFEYQDNYSSTTVEPLPMDEFKVWWVHKNKFSHGEMARGVNRHRQNHVEEEFKRIHDRYGEPGKGFGNKIRKFLQIKSQSRYQGGHKHGRIHRKNAYRVGLDQVGDGSWNRRVFKKKTDSDILDVAVTVLVDFSGSMMGQKVVHAIDSGRLLTASIQSLHIPLQVLTFTECGRDCFIGVAKDFDERLSEEEIHTNMVKTITFMSNNSDGDAILWAYKHLKGRKEKRKVLIVLSDGSPASSRHHNDMYFAQQVVKEIQEEGRVEIMGLGIMDRNVEKIYKKHTTIRHASELEHKLLEIIRDRILNV